MPTLCYLNGRFQPQKEASINVFDLGFLRGFGVFDLALAEKDRVFMEDAHLDRFFDSIKILNLKSPLSKSKIKIITKGLLQKNKSEKSVVRWVISGGLSRDGRFVDKETFAILNEPYHPYPITMYDNGIKVMTIDARREIPSAKTLNYQIVYSIYPKMRASGAFELIYTPKNQVLEASTSNVFIIKDSRVITPSYDILPGITRQIVIDLAKKNGVKIVERPVKKMELENADEVFITATNKGVMPVVRIDDTVVGNGIPGPITKTILQLFLQFENKWRTTG